MVGSSKYNDVFEYYLKWQSDLNTGNYRSFIIGISPLLAELQKKIIEKYYPKQKKIKLNAKWNNTEFTEEIQLVIKKLEKNWKTKGEFIMSYQFNDIIQELSQIPEDIKNMLDEMKNFENKRNIFAHQIKKMSLEDIEKEIGYSIYKINNDSWQIIRILDMEIEKNKKKYRSAYDNINKEIIRLMKE